MKTELFNSLVKKMGLSQGDLAFWMSQENTPATRNSVSRKMLGKCGVTKTDIGLIRALELLHDQGFSVRQPKIGKDGTLLEQLPLRT